MPAMVLRLSPESKAQTGSKRGLSDGRKQLVIDLARTDTDPDERTDFFEHGAGCRELGIAFGTNWAEMRIAEHAWRRFATATEGGAT